MRKKSHVDQASSNIEVLDKCSILSSAERRTVDAYIANIDDQEIRRRWDADDVSRLCLLFQISHDSRVIDRILGLPRVQSMIKAKASRFFLMDGEKDDLIITASFGVSQAIANYDPSRGASCYGHCCWCADRHLITAVRTSTRRKHRVLNGSVRFEALQDECDERDQRNTTAIEGIDSYGADQPHSVEPSPEEVATGFTLEGYVDSFVKVCRLTVFEEFVFRSRVIDSLSYKETFQIWLDEHPTGNRLSKLKCVDNAFARIKRKASRIVAMGGSDPIIEFLTLGLSNPSFAAFVKDEQYRLEAIVARKAKASQKSRVADPEAVRCGIDDIIALLDKEHLTKIKCLVYEGLVAGKPFADIANSSGLDISQVKATYYRLKYLAEDIAATRRKRTPII